MKILPKILIFGLIIVFSTQNAFAETCVELEKGRVIQMKRLETAKIKIFEQDTSSLKIIKEKQLEKVLNIQEKTNNRILELQIILEDLKSLPDNSETVLNVTQTLSREISLYAQKTDESLAAFSSGVDKILEDRSKAIKNVVQQYETGTIQLYDKALTSCKKTGWYDEERFIADMKTAQKRVLDTEKNSKRILQGIDSLYASLSLQLDESDTALNLVLKSIQVSLLENPPEDLKPLSLFRLWKML